MKVDTKVDSKTKRDVSSIKKLVLKTLDKLLNNLRLGV